MKKSVSVIIPVYNTEMYLDKCLSSLVNQTFRDIEIIIVDDGSTDNSYQICQKYANNDKRIVLIQQSNQGQGFARNNGLLKSNGEYIFFLDSDDYLELDTFESLYNEALNHNSDLVCSNRQRICPKTNLTLSYCELIKIDILNSEKKVSYIFSNELDLMVCGKLIKKSLMIDNYLFFQNIYFEDMYIAPKIYFYAKNISFINKITYNWIYREDSTSNRFSMKHAIGIGGLLIDWTNFLIKENIYEIFEKDMLKKFLFWLYWAEERANKFIIKIEEKNKVLEYINSLKNNANPIFNKYNNYHNNFVFSKNINSLFAHIQYLKKHNYKIALFGNGLVGNIVAKALKKHLVVIADNANDSFSKYSKVCKPEELNKYKFDKLVICVLGREEWIINSLDIDKSKIFEFNFLNNSLLEIENSNKSINIEEKKIYDVVFIPHNNYHFKNMALISEKLKEINISSCLIDITDYYKNEGIREVSYNLPKIQFYDLSLLLREEIDYKLLVCVRDWDLKIIKPLLINAKANNKKTLGMVEDINDFFDIDTNMVRKSYKSFQYLFLTGEHDKQFFKEIKNQCFIVGIPRFDNLLKEKIKFPRKILVVINLTFSNLEWLDSVLKACKILNFEYVIIQHESVRADLSSYNVSKLDIYETIRKGSILISRFSSIILDTLAMGKPVVYHNCHSEQVPKFQESLGSYSCSSDVKSLVESIKYELSLRVDYRKRSNYFLNHHCNINDSKNYAKLCVKYIKEILDYE